VRVPEFAGFDNEGRDLEDYPEVLATVTAVWGKQEIFANIEALLFRDQWNTQREPVDLAAFRDLLLLHAVAHTASGLPDELHAATQRSSPRSPFSEPPKFMPQALAPTSAHEPLPELDAAGVVDVDVDLDIDLSLPEPAFPIASADGARHAAVDPGNLIDFDLPKLPDDIGDPKTGA
jgi:pilus assembly protein FimV